MPNLEELRTAWVQADSAAMQLNEEYEKARAELQESYRPKFEEATQKARDAQVAYSNALALHELLGREDVDSASGLAQQMGLVSDHDEFLAAKSGE